VNCSPAELVVCDLSQTKSRFLPSLAHGAFTDCYAFATTSEFGVEHCGEHTATLDTTKGELNEWLYGVGPIDSAATVAIESAVTNNVRTAESDSLRISATSQK
jgi:hypothetical protein